MYVESIQLMRGGLSTWPLIRNEMIKKSIYNFLLIVGALLLAWIWHQRISTIDSGAIGILLVGLGAVRLASVSARVHVRKLYDSTHAPEAIEDREMTKYRPRIAGNAIDVIFGFLLVSVGFIIRVSVDFL